MPRRRLLLDTGPLVAFFDKRDNYHSRAVAFFRDVDANFLTSWPVVTEASHFLPVAKRAGLLRLVESGMLQAADLRPGAGRMAALLEKYADIEPDLADVSLVYLAEATGVAEIATFDDDFSIYRIGGRKRFVVVGP